MYICNFQKFELWVPEIEVEWRCIIMENGGQFVMITGISKVLVLFADSLAFLMLRKHFRNSLPVEVEEFGWTT